MKSLVTKALVVRGVARASAILQTRGVIAVVALSALLGIAASASATTGESDLRSITTLPPRCAHPSETPDASIPICWARFFTSFEALRSQQVLLHIADVEDSQNDCTSIAAASIQTLAVDGQPMPFITDPCRFLPRPDASLSGGPITPNIWITAYGLIIPAGALSVGDHTIQWTATFTNDVTFSAGCTDPSGRCTIRAGTVFTGGPQLLRIVNG